MLACELGARAYETLKRLLNLLQPFNIRLYCADRWETYRRLLSLDLHLMSKRYTQSIERQNLNFRTRLKRLVRRTFCFSKPIEIHDKVVGEFINRMLFHLF